MTDVKGPFRAGALFVAVSAVLHLIAPLVAGLQGMAPMLAVVGLVYLAVTWGLLQGWRWLAWVAFFVLMAGSIVALSNVWAGGPVPGWLWAGIVAADWAAVAGLFVALWRSPQPV